LQEHHAKGGAGATALGEAVMAACKTPSDFKFLYDAKLLVSIGIFKIRR